MAIVIVASAVAYLPSGTKQSTSTSIENLCSNPCVILIQNDVYGNGLPVTVALGTAVTWINDGVAQNTVTSDSGAFQSGVLSLGQNYSYTFNKPGNYSYHNEIHPGSGWIIVTEKHRQFPETSIQ